MAFSIRTLFRNRAPAHFNTGLLHLQDGKSREAEAAFREALRLKRDFPEAWMGLAEALEAGGKGDEALAALLEIPPSHASYDRALHGRIEMLAAMGRRGETVPLLFEAVARQPGDAGLRRSLAHALYGATLGNAGERERAILARLCADDEVSTAGLATAIAGILKGLEPSALATDPLTLVALPRTTFADAQLETALTALRREYLLDPGPASFGFACALARHCFHSGYAFWAGDDELAIVANALEAVDAELRRPAPDFRGLEPMLVAVALYQSLHTIQGAERLSGFAWSKSFKPVAGEQLGDRLREGELSAKITALTTIDDSVSLAVRAMYEENPYPLWVSAQHPDVEPFEALVSRLRPDRPVRPRAAPPQILIAGCGTGLHPIQVARSQPASAILAVDLSIASLAYAARMAERLGINNITFAQADLLRLGTLGRKFSVIESVGVLHHLEDPLSGWRVLTGLLEEDGLMRIALYSTRARSGIRAARDHLGPMNLPRTAEGIRRCRRAIMNLPDGHPARDVLGFGDFYTLNGCRDLLMHVQEHTFTPPQIAECLDTLGLRLLKVECGAQAQERFRTLFPDTAAATDPGAWDRLESAYPDTFRGMIQFWCGKA